MWRCSVEVPPQSLADWVALGIAVDEASGDTLVDLYPFLLRNGTEAYFTSTIDPLDSALYRVDVFANGYSYRLQTLSPESVPTDAADAYMIAILDSFCVD